MFDRLLDWIWELRYLRGGSNFDIDLLFEETKLKDISYPTSERIRDNSHDEDAMEQYGEEYFGN